MSASRGHCDPWKRCASPLVCFAGVYGFASPIASAFVSSHQFSHFTPLIRTPVTPGGSDRAAVWG